MILYGDGSCGYGLVEFDTFVRMKTPVIAVVGNDACWSQVGTELKACSAQGSGARRSAAAPSSAADP